MLEANVQDHKKNNVDSIWIAVFQWKMKPSMLVNDPKKETQYLLLVVGFIGTLFRFLAIEKFNNILFQMYSQCNASYLLSISFQA